MTPFADEVARCRAAQDAWARVPVRDRLRPVREFRRLLVERADALTAAVQADIGRSPDEVVATDLLPSAAACKYLEREAARVLAPRRVGWRPLWLVGCRDTVYRRPHGVVGLIGTWNYPVFVNAVPICQAFAAGNAVLWKPSEVAPKTADALADVFAAAGFPPDLLVRLPATREAGPLVAEADVDFVHFTGSEAVGRKLAARLGERLVPSALELSGCDAMFVLADADAELAARTAWYGATLNGGQTCIATRRVFVARPVYDRFVRALRPLVEKANPVRLATPGQAGQMGRLVGEAVAKGYEVLSPSDEPRGLPPWATPALPSTTGVNPVARRDSPPPRPFSPVGRREEGDVPPALILAAPPDLAACREASFAPLTSVARFDALDDAVRMHAGSPFGLAAAVFTADPAAAAALAERLPVGMVMVNDVIAPTGHPATPFGGRKASGWGATQGAEGLLGMTVPQVVTVRKGTFRPHVDAFLTGDPAAGDVARGLLRFTHARRLRDRLAGLRQLVSGMLRAKKP